MKVYINGISYYLPERILSNEDINREHPEWDVEKITQKTGIQERHIAAREEFSSDMAVKAAEKFFDEYHINRKDIDFLLLCTQSPDYFLPTTACSVQRRLDLPTSIGALDFNLGCSGFTYGLSMAKGLIASNMGKNVLLITSETYSKFIHPKDKSNKTIFGDAAAATLISGEKGIWEVGEFVFGTDGEGLNNLIVRNGGMRYKNTSGTDIYDENNQYVKNEDNLFMDGAAIFSFSSDAVPKLIDDVLAKNNMQESEVDYYVLHQANRYMLEFIRRKAKIDPSKFIYYLQNVGNTVSSTIPIALAEKCINTENAKILLAGFGVGYSWCGCIIKSVK